MYDTAGTVFRGNFLVLNAFGLFKVAQSKSKYKIQVLFYKLILDLHINFLKEYIIYNNTKNFKYLGILKTQKTLKHCEKLKP